MHLGHSLRKLKTPLVDRMDYWYRLERLSCPLLPLEPVSSLTGGCSGDSLISPGRKEDPGWDLCLRGEHPCPCHQDPFLSTDSSYLYFIFRCSHTVCFCLFFFISQSGMKHTVWITMQWWCIHFYFCFSKKNERICVLKWSANICPGFFSSTIKLKKK